MIQILRRSPGTEELILCWLLRLPLLSRWLVFAGLVATTLRGMGKISADWILYVKKIKHRHYGVLP